MVFGTSVRRAGVLLGNHPSVLSEATPLQLATAGLWLSYRTVHQHVSALQIHARNAKTQSHE